MIELRTNSPETSLIKGVMDGKTTFEIHGNGQMDTKVQFEIEFSYLDHYNLNDEYLSFKINGKHFSSIVKYKKTFSYK